MMTKPASPPMTRHSASKPMRKKVPVMATMPVAPMAALASAEARCSRPARGGPQAKNSIASWLGTLSPIAQ